MIGCRRGTDGNCIPNEIPISCGIPSAPHDEVVNDLNKIKNEIEYKPKLGPKRFMNYVMKHDNIQQINVESLEMISGIYKQTGEKKAIKLLKALLKRFAKVKHTSNIIFLTHDNEYISIAIIKKNIKDIIDKCLFFKIVGFVPSIKWNLCY
ncbi:MAG: hypothetical protein RLZZ540_665 [Bacteroidota bacterium]|jgi:hypothetical protein